MTGRFRILLLGVILTTVSIIVSATSMTMLYFTAIDQQRVRLVETAQSQARLIESIARFNVAHHEEWHPGIGVPEDYTLEQIKDAHDNYEGFGETGEFTLSRREGNNIVFLLSHRHFDLDNPKPVPFDSELAEPMRLALSGKSGTIIGLDYRGVNVLAAHEPVGELDLGIVVKIDISEIRKPFLWAGLLSFFVMTVIVIIGILLFSKITNPMIAEQEKLQKQLSGAVELAHLGHWEYDVAADTFTFNDYFYRIFDTTAEEVGGYKMRPEEYAKRFVHPGDLHRVREETQKAIETDDPNFKRRIEHRIIYPDGTIGHISVQIYVVKDDKGKTIKTYGVNQDITEQKQSLIITESLNLLNEELLSSTNLDEKLKLITDGIVEIFKADFARIWMIKPGDLCNSKCEHAKVTSGPHVCENRDSCLHLMASSGRYTHIDGGHHRVPFGCYKIGKVASGEYPKFLTNDVSNDPRIHDHEWAEKIGLVSFAGYRLLASDGKVIGVMALFSKKSISSEENAHLENLAGITTQIIQTSEVYEALKESEERFRELYNDAPVGYMEIDSEGRITSVNRKELEMLGYTSEEIEGRFLADFIMEETASESIDELLLGKKLPTNGRKRNLRKKDGSTLPILIDDILVKNENNNIIGMRSIHIDVSGIQKVEEEREKLIKSLEDALSEVKTLSGLLPICAHCKKIRDDKGYWKQIESYIQERSEAEFSHGICRECAVKFYPDMDIYDD
ncbi:PAS domain S-box protein [Thermodesulfobacteriota bacterium]